MKGWRITFHRWCVLLEHIIVSGPMLTRIHQYRIGVTRVSILMRTADNKSLDSYIMDKGERHA